MRSAGIPWLVGIRVRTSDRGRRGIARLFAESGSTRAFPEIEKANPPGSSSRTTAGQGNDAYGARFEELGGS